MQEGPIYNHLGYMQVSNQTNPKPNHNHNSSCIYFDSY